MLAIGSVSFGDGCTSFILILMLFGNGEQASMRWVIPLILKQKF
jgi:hypothetical protein